MIIRFFISFLRAHSLHVMRIWVIVLLSSLAFLIVAAISTLVDDVIQNETRNILGADIILDSSSSPSDEEIAIIEELRENYDLEIATTVEFQTNVSIDNTPYLSDVKIVSSNYPLVWNALWDDTWVYVSDALLQLLSHTTQIELWQQEFQILWSIPQHGFWDFSLFSEGREIWIREDEIDTSELLWLWARVSYKILILIWDGRIDELTDLLYSDWVLDDWRVSDIASRQDILADVFWEFERFLQVFFTGIFVLAFFSLFFTLEALKRIIKRDIWLFILLWYTKSRIFLGILIIIVFILIIAYILAFLWASQVIAFLQNFSLTENILLNSDHVFQAFVLTFCIVLFGSLYTLHDFYTTTVLNLLKKPDLLSGKSFPKSLLFYLLSGILVLLFFLWAGPYSILMQTSLILIVIILLAFVVKLYFYTLFWIVKAFKEKKFLLFYTLRACIRPWNMTLFISLPIIIVGSVFFFLLIFAISFLDIARIENDDENYFILNIDSEDRDELRERFSNIELYDILLARIQRINDIPLRDFLSTSPRSGEFTREFNLTTNPLPNNRFTRWEELRSGTVSLDEDFAERLWVRIGDEVTFLLSGREVTYQIINKRPAIRWDFRPFFYFQLYPPDVEALERSYFWVLSWTEIQTSDLRSELFDISPRLQLLDVKETLTEVTRILWQVYQWILAITTYVWVFVWILLSVSLTILSSLRKRESERLKLLWAPPSFTRNFLALEYLALLSFSLVLVLLVWTSLSIWFFQSSSLFDFQLSYILKTSGILLLWAVGLYVSILVMQRRG